MPRSADCYWTFPWLAKQATNKLARGLWNPCCTIKTWAVSHFIFYFLVQFDARFPSCLWDSCFLLHFLQQIYALWVVGQRRCRDSWSYAVCLSQSEPGLGVYMQEFLTPKCIFLRMLAQLWEIWQSMIWVGLKFSHIHMHFKKSSFSRTNTINGFFRWCHVNVVSMISVRLVKSIFRWPH